jgi:CheY-like chemotaxis protein
VRTIMLVENDPKHRQLIKQWIELEVPDVTVSQFDDPRLAEQALLGFKQIETVKCIVLDIWFPGKFAKKDQPYGEELLWRYKDIPIVAISGNVETKDLKQKDGVPLHRLEKPTNLLPAGNPALQLKVEEFRRVLIEAVKCALLVGSLKGEVARFNRKNVLLQPAIKTRAGLAAMGLLAFMGAYATSIVIPLPDFIQHLLLTLCAVTGVHLLDRAVLFKDFQEACNSVGQKLDELSVEIHRIGQEESDRSTAKKQPGHLDLSHTT